MSDNLPMILLAILVVAIGLWFVLKPSNADTAKVEAPIEPKPEIAPKATEKPVALVAEPEKVVAAPVPAPKAVTAPKAKAAAKPKTAEKAPTAKAKATAKSSAAEKPKPAAKAKSAAKAAAPAAAVAKPPKAEPKAKAPAKAAAAPKADPKAAATAKAAPKAPAKAAPKPGVKATPKPAAKAAPKPAAKAVPKPAAKAKGPDDLLWIKGLGPKLNTLFIENGVTRFDQIAGWGPADVATMDAKLGNFAGRIARDNFVEQAALLAKGDIAAFEAKYGKLDSENK